MDRAGKEEILGEIKAAFANVQSVVIADFSGVTVPSVTAIRDQFRKAGCEYRVLKNSLVRTEEQIKAYLDKVRNFHWSLKQHPGTDTPLGVSAYAMVQERATYFNYQEMRARIRREYGLPPNPTRAERERLASALRSTSSRTS